MPKRIEIEHEQQIADGAERQGAEDRANGAAAAANQRDAAQHDRRDRKQRIGVAARVGRVARIGEKSEEQSTDPRQQPRQGVSGELGAADRNA